MIETSVDRRLDPALHIAAGRALAPLRATRLALWADAPAGRFSHPEAEQLLPLMVAAGLSDHPGTKIYGEVVLSIALSGYRFD